MYLLISKRPTVPLPKRKGVILMKINLRDYDKTIASADKLIRFWVGGHAMHVAIYDSEVDVFVPSGIEKLVNVENNSDETE